jgi:hypothetical protein
MSLTDAPAARTSSEQHPGGFVGLSPPHSPLRNTMTHSQTNSGDSFRNTMTHSQTNSGDSSRNTLTQSETKSRYSSTLPPSADGGAVHPIFSERKAVVNHLTKRRTSWDIDEYFVSAFPCPRLGPRC